MSGIRAISALITCPVCKGSTMAKDGRRVCLECGGKGEVQAWVTFGSLVAQLHEEQA